MNLDSVFHAIAVCFKLGFRDRLLLLEIYIADSDYICEVGRRVLLSNERNQRKLQKCVVARTTQASRMPMMLKD